MGVSDINAVTLHRPPAARAQRVDGAARIAYACDAQQRSRLQDLYQRAPCRVLFPDVEPGEPPQAVLLTTSGGLTGGDRLALDIEIGAAARATLTTQAAEKLYRAADGEADTRIDVRLRAGSGAWLEWLAQETILFEHARLRRVVEADLAADAQLLAVESIVFGRSAMGEDFTQGQVHDAWRIRRGGRLVWADALRLGGDVGRLRAAPFAFGAARGTATLIYVGDAAAAQLDAVRRDLHETGTGAVRGGATVIDGVLLVRLLAADAGALRGAVMRIAGGLRARLAGLPARLPRVWEC